MYNAGISSLNNLIPKNSSKTVKGEHNISVRVYNNGSYFEGWYLNGGLVSTDYFYDVPDYQSQDDTHITIEGRFMDTQPGGGGGIVPPIEMD